jgi:ketosteroid isomerase-like protein
MLGLDPDIMCLLEAWKKDALGKINAVLESPLQLRVVNVVGGGDQPWAVLELEADGVCKNGMPYPQRYAWVLRFDDEGIIVQAKAYLDSALVQKAVDSNS